MTTAPHNIKLEEDLSRSPIITHMRTLQSEQGQKLDRLEEQFHQLSIRFESFEGKLDTVLEILENHNRILIRHDRHESLLDNHEVRIAAVERAYRDLVGKAH